MENDLESDTYKGNETTVPSPSGWWKVAFLTAGSALAGGIAVAWWYRKTLTKLRETGENPPNPHFGIDGNTTSDRSDEDI
jgi:hypothetical protein